jgi:hypothetical protein
MSLGLLRPIALYKMGIHHCRPDDDDPLHRLRGRLAFIHFRWSFYGQKLSSHGHLHGQAQQSRVAPVHRFDRGRTRWRLHVPNSAESVNHTATLLVLGQRREHICLPKLPKMTPLTKISGRSALFFQNCNFPAESGRGRLHLDEECVNLIELKLNLGS